MVKYKKIRRIQVAANTFREVLNIIFGNSYLKDLKDDFLPKFAFIFVNLLFGKIL